MYFNPHFRKGSDSEGDRATALMSGISIHTSAREVTARETFVEPTYTISIHTSAREVTILDLIDLRNYNISIHTSAREVTLRCFHR